MCSFACACVRMCFRVFACVCLSAFVFACVRLCLRVCACVCVCALVLASLPFCLRVCVCVVGRETTRNSPKDKHRQDQDDDRFCVRVCV